MTDVAKLLIEADSKQVKTADKDLDNISKTAGKAEKSTKKFTKAALGMAAIGATVIVLNKVIVAHRAYTAALSDLSAITGAVGKDLEFYNEQAKKIGETTTLSATQAAVAFKLIASAKPDLLASKEALAAVTMEAVKLAEAAGITMPQAAKALGSSLNQFSADADEASRFINVLAAGAKFGASEISETSLALKTVGTVASGLGLSFEETNAAIQTLASVAIKGSEAGTGLRGALLKLSTQSKEEFNPEIVGLATAMKNLKDAELTTTEKTKLFGLESITAASALINQADKIEGLTESLTGTNTAYEQASIRVDNLDGDMKKLDSVLESVALTMGEKLDPALRGIAQAAASATSAILDFLNSSQSEAKALEIFKRLIEPNIELLNQYGNHMANIDPTNLDQVNQILEAAKHHMIDLEKEAGLVKLQKQIKAASNSYKGFNVALSAAMKNASASPEHIEALRVSLKNQEGSIDSLVGKYIDLANAKEAAEGPALDIDQPAIGDAVATPEDEKKKEEAFNNAIALQEELYNIRLGHEERDRELNEQAIIAKRDYWDRLYNIEKGSQESMLKLGIALRDRDAKSILAHGASALSGMAQRSKKMFSLQKAFALANAAVTLPDAVLQSFRNGGGYPWGLIPAGLMAAQGAAQISAINSSSFGGGGGAASVPGGGGSMPSAPTAAPLPQGARATPNNLEQQGVTTIQFLGPVYGFDDLEDVVVGIVQDASENKDVVLISQTSRNGQELRS